MRRSVSDISFKRSCQTISSLPSKTIANRFNALTPSTRALIVAALRLQSGFPATLFPFVFFLHINLLSTISSNVYLLWIIYRHCH